MNPIECKSQTISSSQVDLSAFGFSQQTLEVAKLAYVSLMTPNANVAMSFIAGDTVTSGRGIALTGVDTYEVQGKANISNLKFIRIGATDCVVSITLGTRYV